MNTTWNAWVNLIVGILLIISPFVLGFSGNVTAMWTAIVGGLIVGIVSLLELVYPARALR